MTTDLCLGIRHDPPAIRKAGAGAPDDRGRLPSGRLNVVGDEGSCKCGCWTLRTALETADVERREQLYQRDAFRLRLRAHDLRATFIILALAQGRSEDWVRTRTGHRASQMIARDRLEAKTAQELELGWLLLLREVIPELAALAPEEPSSDRELSAPARESAPDASGSTLH